MHDGAAFFPKSKLSAKPEQLPPSVERWQIHPGDMVKEMRTDDPVVLDYVSGMPLLVIYEGDMQSVYYLDRVLMLRPGIRFSIAALGNGCEISCRTHQPGRLQLLACHPAEEFSGAASELKLEQLYTFFIRNAPVIFIFEASSMRRLNWSTLTAVNCTIWQAAPTYFCSSSS